MKENGGCFKIKWKKWNKRGVNGVVFLKELKNINNGMYEIGFFNGERYFKERKKKREEINREDIEKGWEEGKKI